MVPLLLLTATAGWGRSTVAWELVLYMVSDQRPASHSYSRTNYTRTSQRNEIERTRRALRNYFYLLIISMSFFLLVYFILYFVV